MSSHVVTLELACGGTANLVTSELVTVTFHATVMMHWGIFLHAQHPVGMLLSLQHGIITDPITM